MGVGALEFARALGSANRDCTNCRIVSTIRHGFVYLRVPGMKCNGLKDRQTNQPYTS